MKELPLPHRHSQSPYSSEVLPPGGGPESPGDGPPKLAPVYAESYTQFTVKGLAHVKPSFGHAGGPIIAEALRDTNAALAIIDVDVPLITSIAVALAVSIPGGGA